MWTWLFNWAPTTLRSNPFIDFSFAKSDVQAMNNPDKRKLLNEITAYLEKNRVHPHIHLDFLQ